MDDARFSGRVPENCLITQVAYYDKTLDRIHYYKAIVELFDDFNIEALKVHEDLLRFYWKQYQISDSRLRFLTRKAEISREIAMSRGDIIKSSGYFMMISFYEQFKIEEMTSDPVRKLVGFLLTNQDYSGYEFFEIAKDVAVEVDYAEVTVYGAKVGSTYRFLR